MDVEIDEAVTAPLAVATTDALRAFQQVMLCLKTEDGQTHIYSVAPLRVKWLIAQLEASLINPDH